MVGLSTWCLSSTIHNDTLTNCSSLSLANSFDTLFHDLTAYKSCCYMRQHRRQMFKSLIRCIFSLPNRPIIMQKSYNAYVPQLNLGPFCMLIGQLVWKKADGLKHLTAMLYACIVVYEELSPKQPSSKSSYILNLI